MNFSIIHVWFLLCELLLASRRYLAKIAAVLQQSPLHRCSWSNTQRMESSIKSVSSLTFCCLSHFLQLFWYHSRPFSAVSLLTFAGHKTKLYHLCLVFTLLINWYISCRIMLLVISNIFGSFKRAIAVLYYTYCSGIWCLFMEWSWLCLYSLHLLVQLSACLYVSFVSAFFSVCIWNFSPLSPQICPTHFWYYSFIHICVKCALLL